MRRKDNALLVENWLLKMRLEHYKQLYETEVKLTDKLLTELMAKEKGSRSAATEKEPRA